MVAAKIHHSSELANQMRIVFMGATELGWNCCRTLLEIGQEVVGIFSIPREFRISWSATPVTNVQYKSFEDLAAAHSIPIFFVTGKMSDPECVAALRELKPDVIIVVGWYYMLPRSLRELAPRGAVGLHASLLPKYRGGAPLVWATINGETRSGVSFFYFTDGVDEGDIIGQAGFDIALQDDISDLVSKASQASVELIRQYAPLLAAGKAPKIPQDHSQATLVPQRRPEDGILEWQKFSVRQAYDWVRAQTRPYPGAFTFLGQEKVTIWKAGIGGSVMGGFLPGSLIPSVPSAPESFGVCCADGQVLLVNEVGIGDQIMSGAEFVTRQVICSDAAFSDQESPDPT
jgi:methionyl-tRNA formyltransferase